MITFISGLIDSDAGKILFRLQSLIWVTTHFCNKLTFVLCIIYKAVYTYIFKVFYTLYLLFSFKVHKNKYIFLLFHLKNIWERQCFNKLGIVCSLLKIGLDVIYFKVLQNVIVISSDLLWKDSNAWITQGRGIKGKEMSLVWHEKASRTALQTSSVFLSHSYDTNKQHDCSQGNCRTMLSTIIKLE